MGKRSRQVASVSRLNCSFSSSRQRSATVRSTLRASTMVVSPRNSMTSLMALALHERRASTTTLAFGLVASVTDSESPLRRLFMPVERALLPQVNVPDQEDGDVNDHLDETESSKAQRLLEHVAINIGPRVQEDSFHIEQNENHGYEIEFDREGLPGIAGRHHAAFVRLLLGAIRAPPAHHGGKGRQYPSERRCHQQVYQKRSICM